MWWVISRHFSVIEKFIMWDQGRSTKEALCSWNKYNGPPVQCPIDKNLKVVAMSYLHNTVLPRKVSILQDFGAVLVSLYQSLVNSTINLNVKLSASS